MRFKSDIEEAQWQPKGASGKCGSISAPEGGRRGGPEAQGAGRGRVRGHAAGAQSRRCAEPRVTRTGPASAQEMSQGRNRRWADL